MNSSLKPIESPRSLFPRRILVIDADSDLRLLYKDALKEPDYNIDLAENAIEGWAALQSKSYHLLITEHALPELTGVELVSKLRGARMALPVVLTVAKLPFYELARNPWLQLSATLVKPFGIEALQATVKSALQEQSFLSL